MKTPTQNIVPRTIRDRMDKAVLHSMTLYVDDPTIKDRITAVAQKEGMSRSAWVRHHILPEIERYIEERLTKLSEPGFRLAPARQQSVFKKMEADALAALQKVQ